MKKLFFVLGIITLIFSSYSCKRNSCENQQSIFLFENKTLEIPFDSLKSIEQYLNYMEKIYCEEGETAQPIIFFDTKKGEIVESNGRNVISLGMEPQPCINEMEYDFDRILEIVLDGKNILIEGNRMPLDSVGQYVYYQYLNYGKRKGFSKFPMGNGIWLITEMKRPLSDFNSILNEIIKGYEEMMDIYCNTFYNKKVCDLSPEELDELKSKLQFHLAIKYSDDVLPKVQITF